MIKNNVYYELFASVQVPNHEEVGYWIDLGADPHGNIIKFFDKTINRWVKLTDATSEYAVAPYIGNNGNWFIENRDSGIPAAGKNPYIGDNFNWFVFVPSENKYIDTGIMAKGLTAYEIAVNHGFKGTEEEWIQSLKQPALDAAAKALEAADNANEATDAAKLATANAEIATEDAHNAADRSNEIADNPPKIVNEEWYMYDELTKEYKPTGIKAIGNPFTIVKTYLSIADMEADYDNPEVGIGEFVMIDTGDVEDPEDSKLYLKGDTEWKFISDLSGMQGIQGLSAYQVAVQNGYVGTEKEWVASLSKASEDAAAAALEAKAQVEATEQLVKDAEVLRVTAETGRVDAETERVSNETTRGTNEDARIVAETARATAETVRSNSETSRVSAESSRVNAEATRSTNEDNRKSAESARVTSESSRFTAEQTRITNETARKSAEESRATEEGKRVTAETSRNEAETNRISAESTRVSQEATRQANEAIRETQETERQTSSSEAITAVNAAKTAAEAATTNATTAATIATTQANRAKEYADNPPKIQDEYWYVWDDTTDAYVNTNHVATGDPGKSPKIENGTWWIYNNATGIYEDTNISVSSDYVLTKEKIEAVLTGDITSHNHDSMYYTESEIDDLLAAVQPKINVIDNLTSTSTTDPLSANQGKVLDEKKVDKVAGKGLSTEDYTTADKTKLAGVAAGAEVNVNADWSATSGDAQILNKPTLSTVATSGSYNDLSNKPSIPSKTSELTKDDVYTKTETDEALSAKVNSSLVGSAEGVAQLDATGKVPASQLPSYVDDVLEYGNLAAFPSAGETGKIYVAIDTNITYRWSGSDYVEISASIALGETSSTAYAGDKGKKNADNIAAITTRVSTAESDVTTLKSSKLDVSAYTAADVLTKIKTVDGTGSGLDADLLDGKESTEYALKTDIPSLVTVDSALSTTSENPVQNKVITNALNTKVDKVDGKGLSTEDYTTVEKTKLGTIPTPSDIATTTSVNTAIANADEVYISNGTKPTSNQEVWIDTSEDVFTTMVVPEAPIDDKQYARKNATWVEVEGGKLTGETAKITVTSNQAQPDTNINGATITVTYGDNTTTLTWQGTELSVEIPVNMSYTVSCSPIEGYATPEEKTYIALFGNTRNISLSYNTTITTINVTSNQSAEDFTTAVTLNLTGGITKTLSGALSYTLNIPTGIQYTITGSDITFEDGLGYATPNPSTVTSVGVTQNTTIEYKSYKVIVNVTADEGSMTGVIEVDKGTGFENPSEWTLFKTLNINSGSSHTLFLPWKKEWFKLRPQEVTNYTIKGEWTISPYSSSDSGRTINIKYTFLSEQVYAYWVIFDESQSTTTLERGGNADVRDAIRAKFKRCVAKPQANGKAAIAYVHPSNSTIWPDATKVYPSGSYNYGEHYMVHFPKYYYRSENLGNSKFKYYISEKQLNENYKEERECLVGIFEAGNYPSPMPHLNSWANVNSYSSDTIANFYNLAKASGSKWGLIDYRIHKTIANMFAIMYGNTDISTANSSIPCSGGTKRYSTGSTGSTLSLGNTDGKVPVTTDSSYYSTSFLGLEDCYYGKWEFVQGVNIKSGGTDRVVYDGGCFPDKFDSALTSAGATNIRTISTGLFSNGYITKIAHGEYADVMPTTVGGSSTTYYADYNYGSTGGPYIFMRSGDSGDGAYCGVFLSLAAASSASDAAFGSRLAFYGDIEVKTKDEWLALSPNYTG